MQTYAIIIYVVILFVGVGGFVWYTDAYKKRPQKTDFSDILNKEWPTYHGGGADEIAKITDDIELSSAVFMWCLPDESDYSIALEQVMQYNPGKRAVYLAHTLDYEVGNGGFNQYFYNKGTVLAPETIRSLRHIGQEKRADILQKALENYQYIEEGHLKAKSAGPVEAQLEAFSETYKDNPVGDLDAQYYDAGPEMYEVLDAYIRKHPTEFEN